MPDCATPVAWDAWSMPRPWLAVCATRHTFLCKACRLHAASVGPNTRLGKSDVRFGVRMLHLLQGLCHAMPFLMNPRPLGLLVQTLGQQSVFQSAHAYRRLHRRRVGHPRLHWPEITMTQAYQRYQARQSPNPVPKPYHINDPLYQHLTASDIAQAHSPLFGNTDLWRNLHPIAQSRREWRHIEFLR